MSMDDNPVIENALEYSTRKKDAVGLCYYGDTFTGYQKVGELTELIPLFKDYYYERRIAHMEVKRGDLLRTIQAFNIEVAAPRGMKFHPYTTQLRSWVKKWDADILATKRGMTEEETAVVPLKTIRQIVKTRGEEDTLLAPDDNSLEAGVRTLGGELINDAMQMLQDEQSNPPDFLEGELAIKRRNYVVNVFSHATKLVHGKAALMLKASEEKRNTAGFLMNLLAKATAGKMSDTEVELLETAYTPKNGTDTITVPQSVQG